MVYMEILEKKMLSLFTFFTLGALIKFFLYFVYAYIALSSQKVCLLACVAQEAEAG